MLGQHTKVDVDPCLANMDIPSDIYSAILFEILLGFHLSDLLAFYLTSYVTV